MPKRKRPNSVKEMIISSLCDLIEEKKNYSDISIQDIVNKAKVCRNSFYRNFTSREDIFKSHFLDIVKEADKCYMEGQNFTMYGLVYSINLVWKKNHRFLKCFYEANPRLYFNTLITRIEASNTDEPIDTVSPEEYYIFAARAWVSVGVLTEWILRGSDLSTEKISKMIEGFLAFD